MSLSIQLPNQLPIRAIFLLLLLIAFIVPPLNSSAETPEVDCDLKTVENFCATLKAKEKTQLRSKIPHRFSNGESMPSVDSITGDTISSYEDGRPNIPWGKMQRLQKIYAQTQKYAEDAILKGRTVDELSSEEKNLIARIKSMKLSDLRSEEEQNICRQNYRFGYSPKNHSLVMCPEMAGYPASGIVWAMAAFMGRGLGTCVTGVTKYTDAKKNLVYDRISESNHPFNLSCSSSGCQTKEDGNSLRNCLMRGGYPDAGPKGIDFSKPELKKIMESEIARSHQAKSPDLPTKTEKLGDALKDEKNIAWAKQLVSDYRECLPEHTNSRVDAGFQDWFGSEVTGRYLEDHPLNAQTPEDNLQPIAAMVDFTCRTPQADELERKFHVPLATRFNSAIFANERLRKAMNCNPKVPAKQICDVSTKPLSPVKSGSGPNDDRGTAR